MVTKKGVPSEAKDELPRILRLARKEEMLITRYGTPAGIPIGFETEDNWFDYRLEHDPQLLGRIEASRRSLRAGRGVGLADLDR